MTPDDLARLHALCFTRPRPWSATEFRNLSEAPGSLLLTDGAAFLLGRVIGPEAELLTLAVDPAVRRRGQGRTLVTRFFTTARAQGADTAFLEVAANNTTAIALYAATGWSEAGRRRGYYGDGIDALVLRRDLTHCGSN
ncbi:GNAT family N-acetyltransferase [Paracoccus sanguinis]|uniref:Ribosomal-protein-alanine N-acetyltransferase n=1 Tax=Paracoccus sanguinis TaxID=1545044 RepID=A0A1H2YD15_9RHOB|nr:GNAT family N-acetyltransferase [Paracoccus sanguinis]KGJ16508.1 alanine acetyltransferase [Paracoccus sanguinis]SDX03103.1 ribosomal-protein-alanine N-acetyltransferase [Paracoccus sanguinis]